MEQKYAKYIDLLKETHNLVLTGAPGTGKTHMAQEIAKEMKAVTKFVQFHPSYDYTDFVEGLRPVEKEDGQMGFERKDGVFKEFCKKAIEGETSVSSPTCHVSFDDAYDAFIKYLKETKQELTFERPRSEPFIVSVGDDSQLRINGNSIKKELVKSFYEHANSSNWYSKHSELIIDYLYDHFHLDKVASIDSQEDKKYVFIIDEINRGEASKIFGELFYAIDPGYRGKKDCMVQTQYQNLVPETDVFAKGFYVPENVYILATMNDIDRSVESMDFAMRRRFTWKEVTPTETASMLDALPCAKEAKAAMTQLNQVIAETDGLGAAYQIGPSYFLKLEKNGGDFDKLWEMNIEPLLKEYLRGFRKASEILGKFKTAYFGANEVTANDNTELKDED
ncbi:MAG: AAA family ATPase [Prevotella sp.]|nr:AAA family ATPase [Prevotella sp.]